MAALILGSWNDVFYQTIRPYVCGSEYSYFSSGFAGEDTRYSVAYESLEQELGKAISLYASGSVAWNTINQGAESLLTNESKDIRIAAWLT